MSNFVRRTAVGLLFLLIPCVAEGQRVSPHTRASRPAGAALAPPGAPMSTADRALMVRLVQAEDRRALGDGDVGVLTDGVRHRLPAMRRVAVRALGRLQQPDLIADIAPALRDADPSVRQEALNAVGQALQGLRGSMVEDSTRRRTLNESVDLLVRAAELSKDPQMLGIAARTLGRLPYADSAMPRDVERVMVEMGQRPASPGRTLVWTDARVAQGIVHGLYGLARSRRLTGTPGTAALQMLRAATTFGLDATVPVTGGATEANARVRRLAYLALAALGDTSSEIVRRGQRDGDEQVRRLSMTAQAALGEVSLRRDLLASGLRDSSFLVRLEAVRAYRALPAPRACAPLMFALYDTSPHVMLSAIDALGGGCAEPQNAVDSLLKVIDTRNAQNAVRAKGAASWQPHAHALTALARLAPSVAIPLLRRDARHPLWQVRLYVAKGAAVVRDTVTLSALAFDANGDVREAALAGISATLGHVADRVFVAALTSPDYHVVLQAATALKGAPLADSVVPPLLAALDRISAERRENSRDPRLALVERIGELGSARYSQRLAPYAADFDSTVAQRSATILERWTLRRVVAKPTAPPPANDPVAGVMGGEFRLLIKMAPSSGGGSFVVRLMPDEAPVTVARIVRLARAGYYAGLTFHRVEPGFVIQGGSPAATEYVGDGPFMRDEVGLPSHVRGTLGISTRGRDTGDAQMFVNLTDNFRLDHDYTVFGEIVQGRDVAEGVLEGDVIERVDVVRVR